MVFFALKNLCMRKLLLIVLSVLLLTPVFSTNLDEGVKATTSITGKVIDKQTGEALTGVSVKLTGLNLTVYSDFDGNFVVDNILPGKYELFVSMLTYEKMNKENFSVEQGNNNFLNIELEPLK